MTATFPGNPGRHHKPVETISYEPRNRLIDRNRVLAGGGRHQRRHPHPVHLHAAIGRILVREGRKLPDPVVSADVTGRHVCPPPAHHPAGP